MQSPRLLIVDPPIRIGEGIPDWNHEPSQACGKMQLEEAAGGKEKESKGIELSIESCNCAVVGSFSTQRASFKFPIQVCCCTAQHRAQDCVENSLFSHRTKSPLQTHLLVVSENILLMTNSAIASGLRASFDMTSNYRSDYALIHSIWTSLPPSASSSSFSGSYGTSSSRWSNHCLICRRQSETLLSLSLELCSSLSWLPFSFDGWVLCCCCCCVLWHSNCWDETTSSGSAFGSLCCVSMLLLRPCAERNEKLIFCAVLLVSIERKKKNFSLFILIDILPSRSFSAHSWTSQCCMFVWHKSNGENFRQFSYASADEEGKKFGKRK